MQWRLPPFLYTQSENSVITLRGSTDIIVEFFQHAITCILYQRGIYPPEDFDRATKYGLALQVAKEEGLVAYIQNVLAQLKEWLTSSNVQKLVVVVNGLESNDVLERWVFNVETAQEAATNPQYVIFAISCLTCLTIMLMFPQNLW